MEIETATEGMSGKIITIIREAENELYLVSPYIQLKKTEDQQWDNLKKAINFAIDQEVVINFITRKPDHTSSDNQLGRLKEFQRSPCRFYFVENLHSKLYYNKNEALITSMNMYLHSALNNLEIGVRIGKDDKEALKKIEKYVNYLISEAETVEYEQEIVEEEQNTEMDLKEDVNTAYCIECGRRIPFDVHLKVVRCKECWKANNLGPIEGKLCHICGKDHSSSLEKPVCRPCYYSM